MSARERRPAVYIITDGPFGTLYVGVTSDLPARIHQHRCATVDGFAKTHGLKRLVWYEAHETMYAAITREKQLKKWRRSWKVLLIIESNPQWRDLFDEITA